MLKPLSTLGGNRTHTPLPELDFESSASTNSATKAYFRESFIFRSFSLPIPDFQYFSRFLASILVLQTSE